MKYQYLLRKNCEYSLVVEADSEEEAFQEGDKVDIRNWEQAWSPTEAELEEGTVVCSICKNPASAIKAHIHQGEWIGDECCWDERLRSSE